MSEEDKIIEQFVNKVGEWMDSNYRADTIHVTSLVYDCARKVWYERKKVKQVPLTADPEGLFRMWIGTKLHETPLTEYHETPLSWLIYGENVTGTIDEIFEIDGKKILIDKKFVGYIPNMIRDHYLKQIQIYAVMLNDIKGIRVDKIGILYSMPIVDYKTNPRNKVYLVDFTDEMLNQTRKEMFDLVNKVSEGLKTDTLPPKNVTWYCKYCLYKDICDKEEKGI